MIQLQDVKSLLLTVLVCLFSGWLLQQLNLPAPFLLGSLFGTWIAGSFMRGFKLSLPALGIPRWFHVSVVLGLSALIGAAFTPDLIPKLSRWSGSVVAMLSTTLLATGMAYYYLHRMRGYDKVMALLCSLPGGQAEVVAISRDLLEKDYVVAFFHLTRVAFIVSFIPLLLLLIEGQEGVEASYVATDQLADVASLSLPVLLQFVGVAVGGYLLAKVIHLAIPHLLGPLLLSSVLHLLGWIEIPRVQEFIILAQVTIGGGVGARLSQVKLRELFGYLGDALVITFLLVSVYCLVALILGQWMGVDLMQMVLAFIPGGLYEVTVLALIFGYELAFVAFHHTIRVLMIFLALPAVVKWFGRNHSR